MESLGRAEIRTASVCTQWSYMLPGTMQHSELISEGLLFPVAEFEETFSND